MKKKKSPKLDADSTSYESCYKFLKHGLLNYFLDREMNLLYRIGTDSFKQIDEEDFFSEVINNGTEISEAIALDQSDFNYIPAHIDLWLEKSRNHDRHKYDKKDLKFFRFDNKTFVHDRKSYDLFQIMHNHFKRVECPIKASMIMCDGGVISEEAAMKKSEFDSFPDYDISHSIIEDDPDYIRTHTPDTGESLLYLNYNSSYYVTQQDNSSLLEILPESFRFIGEKILISNIKRNGQEVAMENAFKDSNYTGIPEYLMRSLFKGKYLCRCKNSSDNTIQWPADCYPNLKNYFLKRGESVITFYYSVDEDEYETLMGDGLYYHYDRAFLSEGIMKKYVELRKQAWNQCNYEPRELSIKLESNQLLFSDPTSSIEEYYPEAILQGLEDLCSDPLQNSRIQELLKVYSILNMRDRCEELIKSFKNKLYDIGKKTQYMDPESPLYYPLLKPCHQYNGCASYIIENTEYPKGAFDICETVHDLNQFHIVEKLHNVISIFEHVHALVLEIDFDITEAATDNQTNPPFDLCVQRLKETIDELNDLLIDMGRILDNEFEPLL